jgi:Excreted virulence factor EspC, type VII ESX diderm
VAVADIEVDPDWVSGYATTVGAASDELSKASDALGESPLGAEAFGELGRTARTADAYTRAATTLRDQLSRAVASLRSASDGLSAVAAQHTGQDEDSASQIKRTHPS